MDLDKLVTVGSLNKAEALYSESASRLVVTVPAAKADAFEALFKGQHIACLGEVTDSGLFTVTSGSSKLISENVEELAKSFKGTLQF